MIRIDGKKYLSAADAAARLNERFGRSDISADYVRRMANPAPGHAPRIRKLAIDQRTNVYLLDDIESVVILHHPGRHPKPKRRRKISRPNQAKPGEPPASPGHRAFLPF